MPDIHDTNAAIAGEAAGLHPRQWPGLAHILRTTAETEREACARIVDANAEGSHGNVRVLVPRTEGNLAGTAYATAIRNRK